MSYIALTPFISKFITTGPKVTQVNKLLNPGLLDGLDNLGKKSYDQLQDIVQKKFVKITPENRSSLFEVERTGGAHSGFLVPKKMQKILQNKLKILLKIMLLILINI